MTIKEYVSTIQVTLNCETLVHTSKPVDLRIFNNAIQQQFYRTVIPQRVEDNDTYSTHIKRVNSVMVNTIGVSNEKTGSKDGV